MATLLGLTWLFGFGLISTGDSKLAFQYIFCILNAFLGVFIFLLHFALRRDVHEEVRRLSKEWTFRSRAGSLAGPHTSLSQKTNSTTLSMSPTSPSTKPLHLAISLDKITSEAEEEEDGPTTSERTSQKGFDYVSSHSRSSTLSNKRTSISSQSAPLFSAKRPSNSSTASDSREHRSNKNTDSNRRQNNNSRRHSKTTELSLEKTGPTLIQIAAPSDSIV